MNVVFYGSNIQILPVSEPVRSKAWVCGCSHAGIVGSSTAGGIDVCCLVLLEVSATGRSLAQRRHTECDVSNECDSGKSKRRHRPNRGFRATRKVLKYWFEFNRIFLSFCEI
jgi:hypothetical protein